MIEGVLFDLDGTLADTAPDLIGALNRLLQEEGRPPLPVAQLRRHVSGGVGALLRQGFGLEPGQAGHERMVNRFLTLYEQHICDESRLFPGVAEVLAALEEAGVPWGIVTNKSQRFTLPLVQRLGLAQRAACVVSGDSAPRAKPHPDPLLLACAQAAVSPSRSLYLGDDLRDIQAGHAAGMWAIVAAYGYLGDGPPYAEWNGDGIIHQPEELLGLLQHFTAPK